VALPLRHVVVNVNDGRDHNLLPRRGFAAVEGRAKSLEVAFARWSRVGDGERTEARRSDRGGARRGVVHAGKEGCERQEANRQEARGKRQEAKRQELGDGAWAHGVASGKSRYAARGPMGESRPESAGK
jgi:hypothetical protein